MVTWHWGNSSPRASAVHWSSLWLWIHLHGTTRNYSTIHARVKSNNRYHVNEEQHKIGFSAEEKEEHIHRFPKSAPKWRPHPHNNKPAITIWKWSLGKFPHVNTPSVKITNPILTENSSEGPLVGSCPFWSGVRGMSFGMLADVMIPYHSHRKGKWGRWAIAMEYLWATSSHSFTIQIFS